MKKILVFFGILFFMVSCSTSSDDDVSSSESSSDNPDLSTQFAEILPAPAASSSSSSQAGLSKESITYPTAITGSWSDSDSDALGSPVYALFRLFGPEDHSSADNWGVENMQNNLTILGYLTAATVMNETNGTALDSAITTLPYTEITRFSDAATSFDYVYNYKVTSGVSLDSYLAWDNDSLFSAIGVSGMDQDNDGVNDEYSAFEGSYDESSNDLELNLALYTDGFAIRIQAEGNTSTNEVAMLKLAKHNPSDATAYKLSLVVKGTVQGSSGAYLAKVKIKESGTEISDVYYCIQASAGEDEFLAAFAADDGTIDSSYVFGKTVSDIIVTTDTNDLASSDCSADVADVTAASYIDYDDAGEMPSAASDYTVGTFWD